MTIFSKIIAGQVPSYKIRENDKFFAFLDISRIRMGHTLVVPKIEIDRFFDLYTSTNHPMNVYSKHFRGKLGFKDVETARRSVRNLEEAYRYFDKLQDRAGQHHTLEMGLTMLDRARWTGKLEEAEVYRLWMVNKLSRPLVDNAKSNVASLDDKRQEKERAAERTEVKRAA